ncbi:sugar porter (SP) family MFS transporter [Roseiarcus fermentans]|uniref:Sugar porter (SP) family MFS transporter n=1 Tax=Roseiarcus fermentans TaxID=1473586 RepID=A0A366FM70_9HYPH|nr:sugar porter family MFS transporter [Roseiarcus fermentans]RBP15784.1 sugar porter (SP) family MFS transporter [Roseiarcus fermentans]
MADRRPPLASSSGAIGEPGDPVAGRLPLIWTISVILVVILAGGLFGYDQGVISGALLGIQKEFTLRSLALEIVTSWVTLGALFGSLAGGWTADHFGRKSALIAAAVLFVAGAAVEAFAPNVPVLLAGRLLVGFGVGVAAVAAPLYAAELAPAEQRGRFISSYQLAITVGIFLAYFVDEALAGAQGWRWMLGLSAAPGVMLLLAVLPAAESPRWLLKTGRVDDARRTLTKLRPGVDVEARLKAMEAALRTEDQTASWGDVFARRWRKPLQVGLGLAILQQITGINAIIYYSDRIFAEAGFTTPAAQTDATTWAIGAVNVLATFIAIAFIDRIGRRPLLLAGLVGMGVSLTAVGFAFLQLRAMGPGERGATGLVTLAALVVFIISFAFSLGPVTWTVINEIYPGVVRGRAVAVATAVNWGAAFLVSEFFLTLVTRIGDALTFWLFALFCALGFVWVYFRVPETRGRSLEQIERFWEAGP